MYSDAQPMAGALSWALASGDAQAESVTWDIHRAVNHVQRIGNETGRIVANELPRV